MKAEKSGECHRQQYIYIYEQNSALMCCYFLIHVKRHFLKVYS